MFVLVDTGAWYALFVKNDPKHTEAMAWYQNNTTPLVTTDFIIRPVAMGASNPVIAQSPDRRFSVLGILKAASHVGSRPPIQAPCHRNRSIDEVLTLLKARQSSAMAIEAGQILWDGAMAQIVYLSTDDIMAGWQVFQTYQDKGWSFTDCTSKAVMEKLNIVTAFAFDRHFEQFGSIIRVPS